MQRLVGLEIKVQGPESRATTKLSVTAVEFVTIVDIK